MHRIAVTLPLIPDTDFACAIAANTLREIIAAEMAIAYSELVDSSAPPPF
jgi:hypothetical protein